MSGEVVFSNARIVTGDDVVVGSLRVVDGAVREVAAGPAPVPGGIDCEGDYLLPGFVELHTDNLERHFAPRPGVAWPRGPAALAHDAQLAASGITTVFDALSIGDLFKNSARVRHLEDMFTAIRDGRRNGAYRAEHFIHLRCELSFDGVVALFEELVDDPLVRLASLMDHTPGQRQFVDEGAYRRYFQGKYGLSDTEIAEFMARQQAAHEKFSADNRRRIVAMCRARGLAMASHDDATVAHVEDARDDGAIISEFPTTHDAAASAHQGGLNVLMGAPNLVLGGSQSGNVAAGALAAAGLLDMLSSDYVPMSLLHGVFVLHEGGAGMPLAEAVALVSRTPARAVGLDDRGEIAPDKRADLVRVAIRGGEPVVVSVWRTGERVL